MTEVTLTVVATDGGNPPSDSSDMQVKIAITDDLSQLPPRWNTVNDQELDDIAIPINETVGTTRTVGAFSATPPEGRV